MKLLSSLLKKPSQIIEPKIAQHIIVFKQTIPITENELFISTNLQNIQTTPNVNHTGITTLKNNLAVFNPNFFGKKKT